MEAKIWNKGNKKETVVKWLILIQLQLTLEQHTIESTYMQIFFNKYTADPFYPRVYIADSTILQSKTALILEQTNTNQKKVIRDKEGYHLIIKMSILQEDITFFYL